MSWVDKIDNSVFSITTGDGKVWQPLWKSSTTEKEFNATVYEFIDQEGAYIDRKKSKARHFPLVFWFAGENCVEIADQFDLSANDSRAWKIQHPFYGTIIGQPLSLSRNDTSFNATEISVDFFETIRDKFPVRNLSVTDDTKEKLQQFTEISPLEYENKVDLKPLDAAVAKDIAGRINTVVSSALNEISYAEYQQQKSEMFAAVDDILVSPSSAIRALQLVVAQPSGFNLSVEQRITLLNNIYNQVLSILKKPTKNNKAYFEAVGGMAVLGAANAAVNPAKNDYMVRREVVKIAADLQNMYKNYVATVDSGYSRISNINQASIAGNGTQGVIKQTVVQTIANLSDLAFAAKQERSVVLSKDSNLILLTHRYMGLDPNDENLERFRTINNIKNKALFVLKKGRQIKYYV